MAAVTVVTRTWDPYRSRVLLDLLGILALLIVLRGDLLEKALAGGAVQLDAALLVRGELLDVLVAHVDRC